MNNFGKIVSGYLSHRRLMSSTGEDGNITPIMPYILMDNAYSLFNEYVKPVCKSGKMKQKKGFWCSAYTSFNMGLFNHIDGELWDDAIELMDRHEEFVRDDLTMCFVHCSNLYNDMDFEREKVLSALSTIDCIIAITQDIWESAYARGRREDKNNPFLATMKKLTINLADMYYTGDRHIKPDENKDIIYDCNKLLQRSCDFIKLIYNG